MASFHERVLDFRVKGSLVAAVPSSPLIITFTTCVPNSNRYWKNDRQVRNQIHRQFFLSCSMNSTTATSSLRNPLTQ